MKIAFIGQKGLPATVGGVETHVENLATGLVSRGHEVFVYARPWYSPKLKKKYKGVKMIYKKSWNRKNFDTITHVFLATLHATYQHYDIIHYQGVGPALLSWWPRIFCPRTKVITTFHSIDRLHLKWGIIARLFLRLGEWFAVRFAHETITVSKTLQKYCLEKYNVRTIYIPNGIYLPKIEPAKMILRKFKLRPNKYILFLSRLVRHKGAHLLIEAFRKISTDFNLVIAGGSAKTDDYVLALKEYAAGDPRVIFTGSIVGQSKLWREIYSNAYLFVLPSEYEGLPTVVLEAMSFGRGVLVSNIPENIEAICGGYGWTFKNKDVEDLRRKLIKLLNEPRKVALVGRAARQHVYKNYYWPDIIKATETVYNCVIKCHSYRDFRQCLVTREMKKF